jgi:hemolysin III
MVSIYFWVKILPKWWQVFFVLAPFFLSRILVYYTLAENIPGAKADPQTVINISYFITGIMIFLPASILVWKDKFQNLILIACSCILFILGLTFREADSWNISFLSMGTHWLWHISTASGSWLLGIYLYHFRKREIERKPLSI